MPELKADLVLEGGGVKGIALVGAISALEDAGYRFQRIAGASAGAIVGAFLAADIRADALEEILRLTNYRRFRDKTFIDRLGPPGLAWSLLRTSGLYSGRYFTEWFNRQIELYSPRAHRLDRPLHFGDLAQPEPGLSRLEDGRLVVMTSDLTRQRLVRFPWDYEAYGLDPMNQPISDAIRASMSIPYFYEPVRLRSFDTGHICCLVDGGLLSNFPIWLFDRPPNETPRWPTFGLKLSAHPDTKTVTGDVNNPFEVAAAIIATTLSAIDNQHIDDPDTVARTIFIDTFNVSPVNFDLDTDTIEKLYQSGRDAALTFLDTWDFDAYIAKYRS